MNQIDPSCIITDNVTLGNNNKILPNTIIYGPTKIGDNNIIGPNVVIGTPGEDTKDKFNQHENGYIQIGDNNIIREFTVIQKPCYGNITQIDNDVYLMHGVHVPHDSYIQTDVVLSPGVVLAGSCKLLKGASLGISSSFHQNTVIGHYSMVGMGQAITKNVRPFSIQVENKKPKVNLYAIVKFGFEDYIDEITKYVKELTMPSSENVLEIIEEFETLHKESKRFIFK